MFPPPRHSQMAVGSAGLPKQPASLKSRKEADRGEGSPGRRDPATQASGGSQGRHAGATVPDPRFPPRPV